MPASVPVPSPLSTNVTPDGSATPPRAMVGAGKPDVVTVNDPATPTVKVVLAALVIAGTGVAAAWILGMFVPETLRKSGVPAEG